jgi:hypothetical protein
MQFQTKFFNDKIYTFKKLLVNTYATFESFVLRLIEMGIQKKSLCKIKCKYSPII